ncbi:hypothetical protein DL96DRAFT_1581526 [Flagelloscypha sp. PMI_526]|nr:hypothetical protein DL96DRAFT_1581526 [Flagelloscypha sp. PMI_526]
MNTQSPIERREASVERNKTHNSSTLIARLPNEILSSIFLLHKNAMLKAHRGSEEYEHRLEFPVPWISPSQVCSSWRMVALEYTVLWNTLFLYSVEATLELLRRSKRAPLEVGVYSDHYRYIFSGFSKTVAKCLSLALRESWRIYALDLTCIILVLQVRSWDDRASFPTLFEGIEYPILRQVTIRGDTRSSSSGSYQSIGQSLLHTFLKQPLRSLNDLRMEHCPVIFWQSLAHETISGIAHLTLYFPVTTLKVYHLLSFLITLPNLQRLDIEDDGKLTFLASMDMTTDTFPRPVLPSLRFLGLTVRSTHLEILLDSIQISSPLNHCLLQPRQPLAESGVQYALDHLRRFQPPHKSASIEIVAFKYSDNLEFHLSTFRDSMAIARETFTLPVSAWSVYPPSDYRSSHLPQIDLIWNQRYFIAGLDRMSYSNDRDAKLLYNVETALQEIEVLSFRLQTPNDRYTHLINSWCGMLSRLPSLKRLDIWHSGVRDQKGLLRLLSPPAPLDSGLGATTQLHCFKNLEELNFENAVFSNETLITATANAPSSPPSTAQDPQTLDDPSQSIEDFFDVLEVRQTAGYNALRRLSFKKSCGVDSEVVRRLQCLVDEIAWDGVTVDASSIDSNFDTF